MGSGRMIVKYRQSEKESYEGNKKEWMGGVHCVKCFVHLINVCIKLFQCSAFSSIE